MKPIAWRAQDRPHQGPDAPDGTLNDQDRIEIGPTPLAYAEWEAAGLILPDLHAMRAYRLRRIVDRLAERDLAGVLVFDPLNIRYATDSTNMQLWNTHNPFRACMVCADGHMVLWEYKNAPFLADHNPLVAEVRSGASMFYFATGDRGGRGERIRGPDRGAIGRPCRDEQAAGGGQDPAAGREGAGTAGFELHEGEEVMEKARAIKGPDEILAMRCASDACEKSVAAMEAACQPGLTEDDVWAVLHAENIRRGGEWIETRLLASGPRTNPWFQECGPRTIQKTRSWPSTPT
jgi:Xaa-Pro dipeptidase